MKLIAYLLLLLSAVMGIAAVDVQKSFLVYFNDDAPESAMSQASMLPPQMTVISLAVPPEGMKEVWGHWHPLARDVETYPG